MIETRIIPGYCVYRCSETVTGRPLMTDIRREQRDNCEIWTCLNCFEARTIPVCSRPSRKPEGIPKSDRHSPGRMVAEFRSMLVQKRIPARFWESFTTQEYGDLMRFSPGQFYARTQAIKYLRYNGLVERIKPGLYRVKEMADVRTA